MLARENYQELIEARVNSPKALVDALISRKRREKLSSDGNLLILAADHTARGKIALGTNPVAMSDRYTLLANLVQALAL
jgi:hypothetical protein